MTEQDRKNKVILEITTIRQNLRIAINKKNWEYVDAQIQRLHLLEKKI